MDYHIRPITFQDKEQFIQLYIAYIEEYMHIERLYPIQFHAEIAPKVWKLIEEKSEEYIGVIAEVEKKVVAFCYGRIYRFDDIEKLYFVGDKRGDAWDLYTAKEYRGLGIGGKLLEALGEEFKKRGCEHMILQSVDFENEKAKQLYEKLGYKPWTMKFYKKL